MGDLAFVLVPKIGFTNHTATPSRTMPNTFFTETIQAPDFGSLGRRPENAPRITYGDPSPHASVKNIPQPNQGSPRWATNTNTPTMIGPTHGAAIIPTVAPRRNTPSSQAFDDNSGAF